MALHVNSFRCSVLDVKASCTRLDSRFYSAFAPPRLAVRLVGKLSLEKVIQVDHAARKMNRSLLALTDGNLKL